MIGVYVVKDGCSGFVNPVCFPNDAFAIRAFKLMIEDSNNIMHYCPSDYSLFKIGTFAQSDGRLTSFDPEFIISGIDCVPKESDFDV